MFRSFLIITFLVFISSCNVRKIAQRTYAAHISKAPYDVVIVPGIAFDTTTQLKNGFNARIIWAQKLYDQGITKNIIFSGAACYSPYTEGEVMRLTAIAMGIPGKNVFSETKAEHGKENVYYSWLLAKKLGFEKIALAADPYQAFFLEGFIQTNMNEMGILPMAVDSIKSYNKPVPRINATSAYVPNFIPLNKRESFRTRVKHTNYNNLPPLPPQD